MINTVDNLLTASNAWHTNNEKKDLVALMKSGRWYSSKRVFLAFDEKNGYKFVELGRLQRVCRYLRNLFRITENTNRNYIEGKLKDILGLQGIDRAPKIRHIVRFLDKLQKRIFESNTDLKVSEIQTKAQTIIKDIREIWKATNATSPKPVYQLTEQNFVVLCLKGKEDQLLLKTPVKASGANKSFSLATDYLKLFANHSSFKKEWEKYAVLELLPKEEVKTTDHQHAPEPKKTPKQQDVIITEGQDDDDEPDFLKDDDFDWGGDKSPKEKSNPQEKVFEHEAEILGKFKDTPGFVKLHHKIDFENGKKVMVQDAAGYELKLPSQGVKIRVSSLDELMHHLQKFDWQSTPALKDKVFHILDDIISGLIKFHHAGYLHLDIKPANILLNRSGKGILADFGSSITKETPFIRGKGVTFGYAAIETLPHDDALENAWHGKKQDAFMTDKADVWSTGMLLHRVFFKEIETHPYFLSFKEASSNLKLIRTEMGIVSQLEKLQKDPDKLKDIYPEPKEPIQHLIWRCTNLDPAKRPSMEQVRKDFKSIREGTYNFGQK